MVVGMGRVGERTSTETAYAKVLRQVEQDVGDLKEDQRILGISRIQKLRGRAVKDDLVAGRGRSYKAKWAFFLKSHESH